MNIKNLIMKILKNEKTYKIIFISNIILVIPYILLILFTNFFAINITPSEKLGIYRVYKIKKNEKVNRGDLVIYSLPKEIRELSTLKGKGNVETLKRVAGLYGDKIEIRNNHIYVNDEDFGKIIDNPKLPKFNGKLEEDEVLTLSKMENTLDGRYYGGVKKTRIKEKARLVYEFKGK